MWWLVARALASPSALPPAVAALTDDPALRARHVAALVADGVLTAEAASHVPSLRELQKALAREKRGFDKPWGCTITGARGAEVQITCTVGRCAGSCIHEVRTVTLAGTKVESVEDEASDDGACGCCEMAW